MAHFLTKKPVLNHYKNTTQPPPAFQNAVLGSVINSRRHLDATSANLIDCFSDCELQYQMMFTAKERLAVVQTGEIILSLLLLSTPTRAQSQAPVTFQDVNSKITTLLNQNSVVLFGWKQLRGYKVITDVVDANLDRLKEGGWVLAVDQTDSFLKNERQAPSLLFGQEYWRMITKAEAKGIDVVAIDHPFSNQKVKPMFFSDVIWQKTRENHMAASIAAMLRSRSNVLLLASSDRLEGIKLRLTELHISTGYLKTDFARDGFLTLQYESLKQVLSAQPVQINKCSLELSLESKILVD